MLLLIFSNVNMSFAEQKLIGRFYTAIEALLTTKLIEIIDKKKFAKAALDKHIKIFVIYMTFLSTIAIDLAKKA